MHDSTTLTSTSQDGSHNTFEQLMTDIQKILTSVYQLEEATYYNPDKHVCKALAQALDSLNSAADTLDDLRSDYQLS